MAGRTRSLSTSPTGREAKNEEDFTYESLIGEQTEGGGSDGQNNVGLTAKKSVDALSKRLTTFREWLSEEAGVDVHPSVCIVNGEATDGTKGAPVLAFGPPPGAQNSLNKKDVNGRVGLVDTESDRALYDRTMGCQVRAAKEMKKDDVMMTMPRKAMITPDLIASSDAAKAVLACCSKKPEQSSSGANFWDAFENTTICETKFTRKVQRNTGTQLLVKILQERKKAENAYTKAVEKLTQPDGDKSYKLAPAGSISTRAAVLAFMIHQRFSNTPRPMVSSDDPSVKEELRVAIDSGDGSALAVAKDIVMPDGTPETFAPYARTLPSSVSLPLSWKRNELALLAGCLPGWAPLQEVAAITLQLASEFVALLEAGILERFPTIFPPGLLTWERWMWAVVCQQSRILPATCYLNDGEQGKVDMQSPLDIFNELGVMVPLMDMVNHEVEAHQVTWQPCVPPSEENGMEVDHPNGKEPHPPRAVVHKRVKKGSQIYCSYGNRNNQYLILTYGFAQVSNPLDEVRIGWGLTDAVGDIECPSDYEPPFKESSENDAVTSGGVYDTTDQEAIKKWWTEERLNLLEREAFKTAKDSFMHLKSGKKMMANASIDGPYHPILLTVAVVATMPTSDVKHNLEQKSPSPIELTFTHQEILRNYLTYTFSRKMEKLLQNLNDGLKDHFTMKKLWTKASMGGLKYGTDEAEGVELEQIGWQTFFDGNAYSATMACENRYYAMGADSCVLTLFDGQLRSLQASIDGLSSEDRFERSVLKQLRDLEYKISNSHGSRASKKDPDSKSQGGNSGEMDTDNGGKEGYAGKSDEHSSSGKNGKDKDRPENDKDDKSKGDDKKKDDGKKASPSKSSRRRNKRKNAAAAAAAAAVNPLVDGDRPPAIKLHIGNLAYSTAPSTLYEFFSSMCGRDSVLECHIPTERDTGRSRGFGFVTLPEPIARQLLKSSKKHEVDGRPLKIAESNSAGSGKTNRLPVPPPSMAAGERCRNCGYRPKYCVCGVPNVPGLGPPPPPPPFPPPHMHPHGPPPPMGGPKDYGRDFDYYGHGGGRMRDDRFNHGGAPPPFVDRPRMGGDRDRHYGRDMDRDQWGHHYDRDRGRSRSHDRSGSRVRDRSRRDRKSRDRSRSRSSRSPSRSSRSGRRRDRDDRRYRRSSSRSRSYSSASSRSRSRSPHGKREHDSAAPSRKEKKVDDVVGKEHNDEAPGRGDNASGGKPRESRKRSHGRGSGGRKKKKKRRPVRSRSRSRSASPRGA